MSRRGSASSSAFVRCVVVVCLVGFVMFALARASAAPQAPVAVPRAVRITPAPLPVSAEVVLPTTVRGQPDRDADAATEAPVPDPPAGPRSYSLFGRSSYIVDVGKARCERPNGPARRTEFWTAAAGYKKLEAHRLRIALALFAVEKARKSGDDERLVHEIDQLLLLANDTQLAVLRPNPKGIGAGVAVYRDAHWQLRECFMREKAELVHDVGLGRCSVSLDTAMHATSAAALAVLRQGTRRDVDRGFEPTHFIDLGARKYATEPARDPISRQDYETSSMRFFEAGYPGFADMRVTAFEVNSRYAASYSLFAERPAGFRYFPAAAWVHNDGLSFMASDMISALDRRCGGEGQDAPGRASYNHPRHRTPCHCAPTVNLAEYITSLGNGAVVLKMDVEGGEWQLVEQLIDNGLLDRVQEIFLECHGAEHQASIFPHVTLPPTPWSADVWRRVADVGWDCFLMHDVLRQHGVVTHFWP